MDDEVLTGLATLVCVVHARVHERLLDALAVDRNRRLIGMLLDDREQVAEQATFSLGQLGAIDRGMRLGMPETVDRRTRPGQQRGRTAPTVTPTASLRCRGDGAVVARLGTTRAATQALGRCFALLRYRRPSSYRCA
jgi:hypothetical protein